MKKVLAGGAFNVIHPGHVWFLKRAKSLGDCLIVVVANDRTVLKRKPLIKPQGDRKKALEGLGIADKILIGDKKDFLRVVRRERPDIIALGYDQEFDEKKLEALGCRVVRIPKYGSHSTSKILEKKRQRAG
jgi:FAD synthetase